MYTKQSDKYTLNKQDVFVWGKNTLIFATPALIIFLTQIQTGSTVEEAAIALKTWLLSTAIDLLRKFIAGR